MRSQKSIDNPKDSDRSDRKPQREDVRAQGRARSRPGAESNSLYERVRESDSSAYDNSKHGKSNLKSDLDNIKAKYDALYNEKKRQLNERARSGAGRLKETIENILEADKGHKANKLRESVSGNLTLKEMSQDNERLHRENEKLAKAAARLKKKADDRKKTLRQLFELMTEKDKELNVYKWTMGAGAGQKQLQLIQDQINKKNRELQKYIEQLEKELTQKEKFMFQLEQDVITVKKAVLAQSRKGLLNVETVDEKQLHPINVASKVIFL